MSHHLATLPSRHLAHILNPRQGCEEKVYGFYPSSLITLVQVRYPPPPPLPLLLNPHPNALTCNPHPSPQMFCSLVTAFCCPVIGAIVDFTPNRRTYGYNLMMGVVVINAIQVATMTIEPTTAQRRHHVVSL